MKSVPEVNTLPDDYVWANYGMRPPVMKEIQIVKATRIYGTPVNVGDVVTITERDALTLDTTGRPMSYPPPPTKEESPKELAERRQNAFSGGPYKVEITRRCMVKGFSCEPGEVIDVCEEDAMNLAVCGRGKIISKPGEEDIMNKVRRIVEEKLRDTSEKM